ncbi:MAG: DMT family transporter [Paracoccaceae bacterium]
MAGQKNMVTRLNQPEILGILWMVLTGLLFLGVTVLVKILGPRVPAPEAAFLRYLLGLVLLIPMLKTSLKDKLDSVLWFNFIARGIFHTLAVVLWFFAMTQIPIAEVTAMNYLSPVYVALGAVLFLKEKMAIRRVLAVIFALVGALVILRPGFREVSVGHVAMMGTAIFFAGSYLFAKHLTNRVSAETVVIMLSILVTIGLFPLAYIVWVPPRVDELMILFGVAVLATLGHYTMTKAFMAAPVTVTQPVTFLQLIWAISVGALFFNENIDPFVIAGGIIIVSSVSFMTWREAVSKKKQVTPVIHETKL